MCFLSADTILLPRIRSESVCDLVLYQIPSHPSETLIACAVFDLAGSHFDASGVHYAHPTISLSGARPNVDSPANAGGSQGTQRSPFEPDDDNSFIRVQYELYIVEGESIHRLYLPRSAFLRYADAKIDSATEHPIPWWEWGHPYARWPDGNVTTTSSLYGSRQAYFERKTQQLTVMNLNSRLRGWSPSIPPTNLATDLVRKWSDGEHSRTTTYLARRELTSANRRDRFVAHIFSDDQHIVLQTVSKCPLGHA